MKKIIYALLYATALLILIEICVELAGILWPPKDILFYAPLFLYPSIHLFILTVIVLFWVYKIKQKIRIMSFFDDETLGRRKKILTIFIVIILSLAVGCFMKQPTAMMVDNCRAADIEKAFVSSMIVSVMIILAICGVIIHRDKKRIKKLQKELHEAQMLLSKNGNKPNTQEIGLSLKKHYELFALTETYRDLKLLYNLKPGQYLREETRVRLVEDVIGAYYDVVNPITELNGDIAKEDVFLCLMYYMGFSTRCISACLAISEEAIRKRKSRIKQKMDAGTNGFGNLLFL